MGNVVKRGIAARELVDAINDLPPTYNQGEGGKYEQFIPDFETEESIQRKLDRVKRAEEKLSNAMNN